MNSKSKLHLEKILIFESTSLELLLEESLSKDSFLGIFCDSNDYVYDKELFTDYPNSHQLVIKLYSYDI